jgi:hypothetical protein
MNLFKGISMSALFFALLSTHTGIAQSNQLETEKGIAASLAPYDADVRNAILLASAHPEILTKLQKSQTQTVSNFQNMISGFRQTKQGWFYTLSRYPELTHSLATMPDGENKEAIYKLLPNQDADLKEAAWKVYDHEEKDLIQMDQVQIAAKEDFNQLIQNLDAPTQQAFQKLSTLPDVLTLLTNNVGLTTQLGKHYHANPDELNRHLAALHDSLNVQNQYEVALFKKQLTDDPQALKEYGQAANDYANTNGYALPSQQDYLNNSYYYGNPYSYWFGYPTWYTYPNWYPGSFGYNSGFYGGVGNFGFYGFPSYGFSNWFYGNRYYNRYPHLYRQFGNYYRVHIGSNRVIGSVNRGFMGVAGKHYNPTSNTRFNQLNSSSNYNRTRGSFYQNRGGNTHFNSNTYHSQSWGSFGGRNNSIGGGNRGGGAHGGRGRN